MPRGRTSTSSEEEWRGFLDGTSPSVKVWRSVRRILARIPRAPRCKTCQAPFEGPLKPILPLFGKRPFEKNPRYCSGCYHWLTESKGGAEVRLSMLFADVRGSTPMAERLGASQFAEVMDRFYGTGVDILVKHDALIERFMGDQIVGYFVPGFAGAMHARVALDAGLELLAATGHTPGKVPWLPVGIGVHTGNAYVGTVGTDVLEFTALGEAVTLAARLASVAAAGELLASEAAYVASGVDAPSERRSLELKGMSAPIAVRILNSRAASGAGSR
jgi:adenylate cyclase